MCRHRTLRISGKRPLLYMHALHGIGHVARPDLRRITEHTEIESSAACRARFDQQIRIFPQNFFKQGIERFHIGKRVRIPREIGRMVSVRYHPVIIPFDVIGRTQFHQPFYATVYIILYLFPRQIEHILIPHKNGVTARILQHEFGMGMHELAFRANHLRFHPDTELQPLFPNLFGKRFEPARFGHIVRPIAERCLFVIAIAEPPVVYDQQFRADCRRTL